MEEELQGQTPAGSGAGIYTLQPWSVAQIANYWGLGNEKDPEIEAQVMTIRMHRRENCIRTCSILHIPHNLDSAMGGGDLEPPL